jgi:ankyrin repeat protein
MNEHQKLQAKILSAAKAGNIDQMAELIDIGANPFELDEHGKSAASYAAEAAPSKIKQLAKITARYAYTHKIEEYQ